MWENITVSNSNSGKTIKIGKIQNGFINMIIDFDPFDNFYFLEELCSDVNVKQVKSINNYDIEFCGIAIEIADDFSFESFSENLNNYLDLS